METVFTRNGWTVDLALENVPAGCEEVFRTTIRAGRQCELFTLLFRDSDLALLQLTLFRNGDTVAETWYPALVATRRAKKYVSVRFIEKVAV